MEHDNVSPSLPAHVQGLERAWLCHCLQVAGDHLCLHSTQYGLYHLHPFLREGGGKEEREGEEREKRRESGGRKEEMEGGGRKRGRVGGRKSGRVRGGEGREGGWGEGRVGG